MGGPQSHDRYLAVRDEALGDPELMERVNRLCPDAQRRWVRHIKRRFLAGEPLDGIGWRALVDVRWEYPPPDGWRGLFRQAPSSPDALPPGWPATATPPTPDQLRQAEAWLRRMLTPEPRSVADLKALAQDDRIPWPHIEAAAQSLRIIRYELGHDLQPVWGLPVRRCRKCGGTTFVLVPIHKGQSAREDCEHCHAFQRFVRWYGQEVQDNPPANADERERLRELLLAEGQKRGWPSVKLAPWSTLQAGEEAWRKYLDYPSHGLPEYQRLLQALNRSEHT